MKRKKPKSKPGPVAQSPECPACGLASEAEGQICHSCAVVYQEIIDLALKRSAMIRYAPFHFYEVICLYRIWQRNNRRQRVLKRAEVIDHWFGINRHKKSEKKRFWALHMMFTEFLASTLISQAEEKVEEMFKMLERR
jgi:hypothetical protein